MANCLEHYGNIDIDFTKTKYTFIANNDNGEVLGVLRLEIEANLAFIDALLIGSLYRRLGIGRKLLAKAEIFSREKKCTKIYLETNKGWDAVEFYKKNNYKITGVHEKHFMNQDTYIFTKFI